MATNEVKPEEALAHFSTMISSYEHRIGHACRAVASAIIKLLQARNTLPPSKPSTTPIPSPLHILDNACGTGAVTQELLQTFPPTASTSTSTSTSPSTSISISASDIVPGMVSAFRALIDTFPISQRALIKSIDLEDSQTLTCYTPATFDISITNLGIFFFPDPVLGARQIHRTLKPGGTAVVTVWKSLGFEPILFEVQDRVKPVDPLRELVLNKPWYDSEKLRGVLEEGGFGRGVEFEVVETAIWGRDKEDFKQVLVENCGAMVSRNWTEGERMMLGPTISDVIDEMADVFCVSDGERLGCRMEAWVAICTK